MKYRIDMVSARDDHMKIVGWCYGSIPTNIIDYKVFDEAGNAIAASITRVRRDDVSQNYLGRILEMDLGFEISFECDSQKKYILHICDGSRIKRLKFRGDGVYRTRWMKFRSIANMRTIKKSLKFLRDYGPKAFIKKTINRIKGRDDILEYHLWYEKTKPSRQQLDSQRAYVPTDSDPLFSIVIPAYETNETYLKELLDSLLSQTYSKFEICIADGSRHEHSIEGIVSRFADSRIKYRLLDENLGISGNTNAALEMAEGDFIVLCDHDDTIPAHALYEVMLAVGANPMCDCLYTDEDKIDMKTGRYADAHFKPDFNIDLLCSVNYICHMFVVRRALVDRYGAFDPEFDGSQDYDFIFRMTENARQIVHIPKVLYHWRCHEQSTAARPESKLYAYEAGARAIEAHYKRVHPSIEIQSIEKGAEYGIYHTYFKKQTEEELISVIIPNKDHTDDLDKAVRGLIERGTYKNLEFIIVENNSTSDETFAYYEKIQKEFGQVRVVYWKDVFNYSAINNFGATFANGKYILFMNNDIDIIEPDSIHELYGYAQRDDVGVVGCLLLYEDDTIQHAGVVVGFGGVAGHTFIGIDPKVQLTYFNRAFIAQDYSAVTAACMLVKKEAFEKVGGFSTELAVAFNDIDLCLKIRQAGYLVVYNPYAVFHHFESKTRGLEDTDAKIRRFNRETAILVERWHDIIMGGDPYYNPNLTLCRSDFALRDLLVEQIGEPYKNIERMKKYL